MYFNFQFSIELEIKTIDTSNIRKALNFRIKVLFFSIIALL